MIILATTIFTIIHGVILSFILALRRKGNLTANRWLALFLVACMVSVLSVYIQYAKIHLLFPHLFIISTVAVFLLGPALYFYVLFLTSIHRKSRWTDAIHFIPFLLYSIFLLILIISSSTDTLTGFLKEMDADVLEGVRFGLLPSLKLLHLIVYTILMLNVLRRHSSRIKNNFSNLDQINLRWLRYFVGIFIFMQIISFFSPFILKEFSSYEIWQKSDVVFAYFMAFFIMFAGYAGLIQPEIFAGNVVHKWVEPVEESKNNVLPLEGHDIELHKKLKDVMKRDKLYLDNDLTLAKLSEAVGITPHQLSKLINTAENKNFFRFINKYRVDEAMRLLSNKEYNNKYTILQVAFDSGFNNKNSFNKAFKEIAGLTPYEFRSRQQK